MVNNVIETPVGTFTRKSNTTYGFAAVCEAAENPEQGLRVVGGRKGDPALAYSETIHYEDGSGSYVATEARVRYHIVWSRTAAGAQKNAESYVWAKTRVVGVFPVTVK